VVVVEAVHAPDGQQQPGRLVRAVAGPDGLVEHAGPTVSSSQSIPTQTIGLAATLGTGRRVVFVGVEVADVSAGRPLSAPVAAGLSSLVGMIVVEVEKLIAAQDARERPPDPRLPAGHQTPERTPSLNGRT